MKIGTLEIGSDAPCAVIAEVGNAHNGDFDRAISILDAIKAAGASAAKFQCYTPDELIALRGDGPAPAQWGEQGWTMRSLYEKAQTPFAWFPDLVAHCESIDLPWFSSVFGPDSLALLESLNCPVYKIARLDNEDGNLRSLITATGKGVIVSEYGVDEERPWYQRAHISLFCPPGYPQPAIKFGDEFNHRICDGNVDGCSIVGPPYDGFSYHGTNPTVPTFAVVRGAKVIEVHVQLDNEPSELEANVSLTMTQLAILVRGVRYAESML